MIYRHVKRGLQTLILSLAEIINQAACKSFTLSAPVRHLRNEKGLEPKCVPQMFLGLLLGTRRSAIGQFFPVPSNRSKVFAKVNLAQLPSRF